MAGSYPDAPSRRMAWDADGSVGVRYQCFGYDGIGQLRGAYTEYSQSDRTEANDEDTVQFFYGGGSSAPFIHGVIFPELRDIYGFWACSSNANSGYIHYVWTSEDTTNLVDGTWDVVTTAFDSSFYSIALTSYRTRVQSFDSTTWSPGGVRAIAFSEGGGSFSQAYLTSLHIYGDIAAGQTSDRLLYIDNSTGLEYTLPIDWGDIPRGAVYDEEFYLKNNSSTLDAGNTNLDFESLYRGSDAFYTLSTGVGWSTSHGPITTIQASSRYPASPNYLTVRCDPPSTAALGLHAARIVMDTSSWT